MTTEIVARRNLEVKSSEFSDFQPTM